MTTGKRWLVAAMMLAAIQGGVVSAGLTPAAGGAGAAVSVAQVPTDEAAVAHALSRLAWGPRPGELQRVQRQGLACWIDEQLHPERLPDNSAAHLQGLATLQLTSAELRRRYDLPPQAKRERRRRSAELQQVAEAQQRRTRSELRRRYAGQLDGTPRQVLEELQAAKVLRAVHSERQLDELLVDFWMNHFNVYARKGPLRFLVGAYEREAIRPHAWGRFEDLLRATAASPAMLFYLDNWLSTASTETGAASRRRGLNENYARELLELHTVGVDGGYTQQDVTAVARVFTGWTLRDARRGEPRFVFDARRHERGDKQVLGQHIAAGGQDEGERVLRLLARHPSTARFIAFKLARRFVADEPPAALVARAAETYSRTQGDIRAVMTTLVTSPEFFATSARAAKVKTPFDFVVSAVRASGLTVRDGRDLARRVGEMGMPLYLQQPPTGYRDTADAWVSTGGLLGRLNFALDLTAGQVRGLESSSRWLAEFESLPPASVRERLAEALVPRGLSPATRAVLAEQDAQAPPATRLAGLILGSPEFQRR